MANTLEIVIKATDKASGVLNDVGNKTSKFGAAGKLALGGVAAAAGLAVAGIGAIAGAAAALSPMIDLAKEFEASLVTLGIAASASGESLETLEAAAIAVGGDASLLGVSASGAAEAMTGLYKAGLTTTEIMGDMQGYLAGTAELGGALRAAIDLAAASELDMVQASDLVAIALATFGGALETETERAEFINAAMNNMVQAADASVAEVGDLAAALSTAGPVFAQYGYSIEDTNNALAILSTRGITGAEAGTALKSMLMNMLRPTKDVQEAWGSLGLSMYDTEGNMRDLRDVVGDLEGALSGMTEQQRNQYMTTLAGSYGIKALSTLLAEGAEGWDAMAEATANAAGIQAQAAAKANTLAGAQEALDGALETIKIQIGQAFIPALTTLTRKFADLAEEYGPAVVEMAGQLGAWLGEFLPLAVEWLIEALLRVRETLTAVNAWWQEHGDTVMEIVAYAWANISSVVETAIAFVQGVIALGTAVIQGDWRGAWDAVQGLIGTVMDYIGDRIQRTLGLILGWFGLHRTQVESTTSGLWATVRGVVDTTLKGLTALIGGALEMIRGWWQKHGDSVLTIARAAWEAVQQSIARVLNIIQGVIGAAVAAIQWVWANFGDDILAVMQNSWELIKVVFETAAAVLGGIIDAIAAAITGDWTAFGEALRDITDALWNLIKESFETAWDSLLIIVTGIVTAVVDAWNEIDWGAVGTSIIEGISGGITSGAQLIKDAALEAAKGAWKGVRAFFGIDSPSKLFAEIGTQMMQGMALGIEAHAAAPASAAVSASQQTVSHVTNHYTYNVTGNYAYQSQASITDEVRLLSLLARS